MTHTQILRRLIYAFLLAVLIAVALALSENVHAQAAEDVLIPCPNNCKTFCDSLEPYGYWWFFWGCNT